MASLGFSFIICKASRVILVLTQHGWAQSKSWLWQYSSNPQHVWGPLPMLLNVFPIWGNVTRYPQVQLVICERTCHCGRDVSGWQPGGVLSRAQEGRGSTLQCRDVESEAQRSKSTQEGSRQTSLTVMGSRVAYSVPGSFIHGSSHYCRIISVHLDHDFRRQYCSSEVVLTFHLHW